VARTWLGACGDALNSSTTSTPPASVTTGEASRKIDEWGVAAVALQG
jgi:hypothetical protein